MDLESETSRGISFKNFLVIAFQLKNGEFSTLYSRASKWTSEPSFKDKLDVYKFKAENRDAYSTASFVKAGNIALEAAMQDCNVPEERRIKLFHAGWMDVDGLIPDVAIVPACLDSDDFVKDGKVHWERSLGFAQVWPPKQPRIKKRKVAISEDAIEEPPTKQSRSDGSNDVSDARPTNVVDAAERSQATGHSPRISNISSLSSVSTNGDKNGSPSSCSSSSETLCKESAEGELIEVFSSAFAAHGDRTFALGACVHGTRVKLMVASHSGVVESNEIDFVQEPELFVIFLTMFATSSLANLGFNARTGFCNPFAPDDDRTRRVDINLESFPLDNNQIEQPDLTEIRLGQKIASCRGLVGRATSVYRLEHPEYSFDLVMKYSWQVKTHRREDIVIRAAREADPVHTPELFGTAVVEDASPFESLRKVCRRKSKEHESRELRVLVMREYCPLSKLGFGDEFWDAYAQLLGCAHDLYRKKRILHHDISIWNLAFYRAEDGKPVAVLIDYDFATMPPFEEPKSSERIGTAPFMARELLLIPEIKYGLHHDYESFFFCAVWHGLGYETLEKYPCEEGHDDDILKGWRTGEFERMADWKCTFMLYRHKAFDLILDRTFSDTCLQIWRQFRKASVALTREWGKKDANDPLLYSIVAGYAPGTKVTYAMLMSALGKECNDESCGEDCCNY